MSVMEEKPTRTRRVFTDEFKRDAVSMVLDEGYKIVDVADRVGSVKGRLVIGSVRNGSTGATGPV